MSKKGLGKFLGGAAVGAGLALLFAPKTGEETRKDLKEKGTKLVKDIKNIDSDDIKKKLNELKKDLKNLDKETVVETIKEKASKIIDKADDLINTAKEKSAPAIEQAGEEIKNKTIKILKKAIDKLEGAEEVVPKGKKTSKTAKAKKA